MKIFTLRVFFLALVIATAFSGTTRACNLSDISLCGVTPGPGLNWTICIVACNGYGRTGATKGADNDTRSISFGWYDSNPGFAVISYLPLEIVSGRGFSNCTMPGLPPLGPTGPPYDADDVVLFVDPGYYGLDPCVTQPFGCVTTTALCGDVAQQCITYTFIVNQVPDSMRVFGIEGGGNPVAGCYPDVDMMIDFTTLAVEWGTVEGRVQQQSIQLEWTTVSESNSDFFVVERAVGSGAFEEIGTVTAAGTSATTLRYEFFDLAPTPGTNRYRLMQVDKNGNTDNSTAVEVSFEGPVGLAWGSVGPNPAADFVNLTFFDDRSQGLTLVMHDAGGKSVIRREIQSVTGANSIHMAMRNMERGTYFVSLQGENGQLTRKIIKQ